MCVVALDELEDLSLPSHMHVRLDLSMLPAKRQFKEFISLLLHRFECSSIQQLKSLPLSKTMLVLQLVNFQQHICTEAFERICHFLAERFASKCCILFCSSLGLQSVKFVQRRTIPLCTFVQINEDTEQQNLFVAFMESWLFSFPPNVVPLMLGEKLLSFLHDDFSHFHRNIARTYFSLKLIVLEFFWGNPFSILYASKLDYSLCIGSPLIEFLRMQPSFQCFIETLVYGKDCDAASKEKAKLLFNDSYFIRSLPVLIELGRSRARNCQYLAMFLHLLQPQFSTKLSWLECIVADGYSCNAFTHSQKWFDFLGVIAALNKDDFFTLLGQISVILNSHSDIENLNSHSSNETLNFVQWAVYSVESNKDLLADDCTRESSKLKSLKRELSQKLLHFSSSLLNADGSVFNEVLLLDSVKSLALTMHPNPRSSISNSLQFADSYLKNNDLAVTKMFRLWKEAGKTISSFDMFQQFVSLNQTDVKDTKSLAVFMQFMNEFEFIGLIEICKSNGSQVTKQILSS